MPEQITPQYGGEDELEKVLTEREMVLADESALLEEMREAQTSGDTAALRALAAQYNEVLQRSGELEDKMRGVLGRMLELSNGESAEDSI